MAMNIILLSSSCSADVILFSGRRNRIDYRTSVNVNKKNDIIGVIYTRVE